MTEELAHHEGHDWHSPQYVEEWIAEDISCDAERRPLLRELLGHAPVPVDAHLRILDVGAGYGLLSALALEEFPNAHVTLLDFSRPMLDRAQTRLAANESRTAFLLRDLTSGKWNAGLERSFDLVITGFTIHNLEKAEVIEGAYRGIISVMKPSAHFLEHDFVSFCGGRSAQEAMLNRAGFRHVRCIRDEYPTAMMDCSI